MMCLPVPGSSVTVRQYYCMIHFYGSKYCLEENSSFVTVVNRKEHDFQMRTASKLIEELKKDITLALN